MAHGKVTADAEPEELAPAEFDPLELEPLELDPAELDPAELDPLLATLDGAALVAAPVEELAVLLSDPQAARNNAAAANRPAVFTTETVRVIFTQILHVFFSCQKEGAAHLPRMTLEEHGGRLAPAR